MNGLSLVAAGLLLFQTAFSAQEPTEIMPLFHPELVDEMKLFVWPGAQDSLLLGPEDAVYYALSAAQIEDLVSFWRARREMFRYREEAWDCDDFAREFLHLSRIWSMRTLGGLPIAPAVGSAYILVDGNYELFPGAPMVTGAAHVINLILRDDGQWLFFEPQSGVLLPVEGPIYESVKVLKVQI